MNDVSPDADVSQDEDSQGVGEHGDAGWEAAPVGPQVPAYIAVIRIVAVLGMGLCMSFGLFLMLVGLKGVLIGVPVFLLAVPFYYGMRLAERLAGAEEPRAEA